MSDHAITTDELIKHAPPSVFYQPRFVRQFLEVLPPERECIPAVKYIRDDVATARESALIDTIARLTAERDSARDGEGELAQACMDAERALFEEYNNGRKVFEPGEALASYAKRKEGR